MLTALRHRLRARLARVRGDAGVTLMELMVTMVVAAIIGAFTTQWMVSSSDALTSTTNTDLATASARNALLSWGKMLQLAGTENADGSHGNGISAISTTSISFTAYLQNSGSCAANTACTELATTPVTLALTNGELVETVGTASTDYVVTATTTATGPDGCLFTAYTASGLLGCSSTLTTDDLSSVTSVTLSFSVTADGHARSYQTTAAFTS